MSPLFLFTAGVLCLLASFGLIVAGSNLAGLFFLLAWVLMIAAASV